MALDTNDVEAIGRVIQTRIDEYDKKIRGEINQAFTQTGEAFEARLQQVIETERTLFFQALQEIMEMVRVTQAMVGGMTAQPGPVAPEDVDDDAFVSEMGPETEYAAPVQNPPQKGIITQTAPPSPPIGGATFGGG